MFMDEARFGRISDTRCCWCPKPFRPVCYSMVSQEYTYAYAAVSVTDGKTDSLILPYVNGDCMQIFLDEMAARYPTHRMIMVLLWDDLREKAFHNLVFNSLDALEDHLEAELRNIENDQDRVHSIVARPWIINALMN